jgi:hypothetical protein
MIERRYALPPFVAACLLAAHAATFAVPFVVDARLNSIVSGSGLATISLLAGQSFTVTADVNDLWSAGSGPRWSNADGLTGLVFQTALTDATDSSKGNAPYPIGAQVGQDFGIGSAFGLQAHTGTLVGSLNGGASFFKLGTNYTGVAVTAGTLKLYYFDAGGQANEGAITANVTAAVPEAGSVALSLAGMGVLAASMSLRRRRQGALESAH